MLQISTPKIVGVNIEWSGAGTTWTPKVGSIVLDDEGNLYKVTSVCHETRRKLCNLMRLNGNLKGVSCGLHSENLFPSANEWLAFKQNELVAQFNSLKSTIDSLKK